MAERHDNFNGNLRLKSKITINRVLTRKLIICGNLRKIVIVRSGASYADCKQE